MTTALEWGLYAVCSWGWVVNTKPRPLYPRKRPGTHWVGGWVGPRDGLDWCGKSHPPPGFDPWTVHPIECRYTDWVIAVHRQATYIVSVTPRPLFTPRKEPVPIVQEAGWAPGPVWTGAENLAPTGIQSPDRPACSQSLYRPTEMLHPEPILSVKHVKSQTTMDCSVRNTVFGLDLISGMTVVIDNNVSISNCVHRINP